MVSFEQLGPDKYFSYSCMKIYIVADQMGILNIFFFFEK